MINRRFGALRVRHERATALQMDWATYKWPATSSSMAVSSVFVCAIMSAVQATQKMGRVVNPFFSFGIWKQASPVATFSEHLSQCVAFPHV